MTTLKIYEEYSVKEHYFASYIPIYGRSESLEESYAVNKDHSELIVYPSFSPAVFIVPYVTFKLLHLNFSYTNLQLFSLLVHLLCTILVFFVVRSYVTKKYSPNLIATLAASVYIFSTSALNDHMNVWWAHQLMQPVYLFALLRFIQTKGMLRLWELFLYSLMLILINWTGLFVTLGMAIYYVITLYKVRQRHNIYPILAICAGGLLAITLIVMQVLFVTNIDLTTYISKVLTRVDSRSAAVDYVPVASLILNYIGNIVIDFGAYIVGLVVVLFYLYKKRYYTKSEDAFKWAVVSITCLPVLESFLLIEHDTVYGFGRLKLLIPLILTVSLLTSILIQHSKHRKYTTSVGLIAIFTLCAIIHSSLYLNIYGNGSEKENNYQRYLPAVAEPQIPR